MNFYSLIYGQAEKKKKTKAKLDRKLIFLEFHGFQHRKGKIKFY